MTPKFDFQGRDIWLVGGAGYLGTPSVRLLADHGATILCADLDQRAQEMVAREGLAKSVTPATLNAGDTDAVTRFVETQIRDRGIPHGLVIMTYRSFAKSIQDLQPAEFDEANHVSLTSTFLLAREVGNAMAGEKRGSIVLFSSMYGTVAPDPGAYPSPIFPNPIEYGVGKAGIQQMARYLGVYFGPAQVRCNSISPGPFPFPSQQEASPEMMRRLVAKVPLARLGNSDEMAGPLLFLLADASTYITGHNLAVDGGWTAW